MFTIIILKCSARERNSLAHPIVRGYAHHEHKTRPITGHTMAKRVKRKKSA